MTNGIHHFAIQVRDLPAAERFYGGVLGLAVVRRWPATDGAGGERALWMATGDDAGTFLALEAVTAGPPTARDDAGRATRAGHHLLALRIPGAACAAWEARLAAAGVPVTHRTAFTHYFTDPEGHPLGLSHYPDPHGDAEPGRAAEHA